MTLSGFVLFTLGALCELIWLYEGAREARERTAAGGDARVLALRGGSPALRGGFRAGPLSREATLIGLLTLAALLLVGLFDWVGWGAILVDIGTPVVSSIMGVLMLAVLGAALLAAAFVPVINEQTLLLVQGLVIMGAFWGGTPVDWLPLPLLTVVPALLGVGLVAWRRAFPPLVKSLLYVWYLACLMILPFQTGQTAFFRAAELSGLDAYAFGGLMVFLILHGLLAVRFFLIVSSLIRPRNRPLVERLMPRLFGDEQVPMLRFALVAVLLAAIVVGNRLYAWADPATAFGLATLLGVQLMSRRA